MSKHPKAPALRRFYAEEKTFKGTYAPKVFHGDDPRKRATGQSRDVINVHELLCENSNTDHITMGELYDHFNGGEKLNIKSRPIGGKAS